MHSFLGGPGFVQASCWLTSCHMASFNLLPWTPGVVSHMASPIVPTTYSTIIDQPCDDHRSTLQHHVPTTYNHRSNPATIIDQPCNPICQQHTINDKPCEDHRSTCDDHRSTPIKQTKAWRASVQHASSRRSNEFFWQVPIRSKRFGCGSFRRRAFRTTSSSPPFQPGSLHLGCRGWAWPPRP
eukprot:jgi/Botrbrau1/13940/Bobra.0193s0007.2